ncbi:DNA replication/repair protein RecF [Marinomonas piezotolerans]|uniref:DNA replication and repair protein RecF n=1 Tax=Marinomonas piezotolerans TaxID=2213058 RepID=A0A370UB17_9GAMM|nr:DNA replication/repair protein RecF [Marinomonas piezotolerans]RDL44931.1 DNA replication/repair protein RecF [Marinomonas piezotolerans]
MPLARLDISHLRNLTAVRFDPSPHVNIIVGENGSGKTSILEAIHLLSFGRSFRSHKHKTYIQYEQPECVVFAQLEQDQQPRIPVGIKRSRDGAIEVRIQGRAAQSVVELAERLPVQLINPDAFRLLEGSPKIRRQFVDWGVFHFDDRFINAWRDWQKALKQRNSLLRRGKISANLLAAFDQELIRLGEYVNTARKAYVAALTPHFESVLQQLAAGLSVQLNFFQGWDAQKTLSEAIEHSYQRDIDVGYTNTGPQRADLRVKTPSGDALDTLSRGQQKLVVSALKIAQGQLLIERGRQLVFLVDDLPAELDANHRRRLCQLLESLNSQIFITSVGPDSMDFTWSDQTDVRHFSMNQGELSQASKGLQES